MKIYIILALVALASAEEWKLKTMAEWSQIHKSCDQRHKVSDELIEKTKVEKYPPKEVFEVVLCILRGIEVWNDSTGFSTDRLLIGLESIEHKTQVSKEFLRESIDKCNDKNTEGSSPLDWAYRVFKCFIDNERFNRILRDIVFVEPEKGNKVEK